MTPAPGIGLPNSRTNVCSLPATVSFSSAGSVPLPRTIIEALLWCFAVARTAAPRRSMRARYGGLSGENTWAHASSRLSGTVIATVTGPAGPRPRERKLVREVLGDTYCPAPLTNIFTSFAPSTETQCGRRTCCLPMSVSNNGA